MFSRGIQMKPWREIDQYCLKTDSTYPGVFDMLFYSSILLCTYFVHLLFQAYYLFVSQLRVFGWY